MSGSKNVPSLGSAHPLDGDELIHCVDDPSGTPTSENLTPDGIITYINSAGTVDHGSLSGLADDDHSQYHNDARGDARYLKLDASNDPITGNLQIQTGAATSLTINSSLSGGTSSIEIGGGGTGNRLSLVDLVGDATYTDYGLRIIRNAGGANTTSRIDHRGTGPLSLRAREAGSILLEVQDGTHQAALTSGGDFIIGGTSANAKLDVRGSAIFNEDGGDNDLRVEGNTDPNLFFCDAGTNRVGVLTNTPGKDFDVSGAIRGSTIEAGAPSGSGTLGIGGGFWTQDLFFIDAGTVGATQQAWVQVTHGGTTGYLHIFAAK